MIKWIKVRNPYNEELTVTLTESEPSHGLLIKEITGLGAPKATISTSDFAILDGSYINNVKAEKRTITITFLFTFADDIESSRQRTYKYFPIKQKVRLYICTDHKAVHIDGVVESNEPGIFAENEETTISLVCEDPYFVSDDSVSFLSLEGSAERQKIFEFPFENDSLTDKKLEFGQVMEGSLSETWNKKYVLNYEGDVPVGMELRAFFKKENVSALNDLIASYHSNGEDLALIIRNLTTKQDCVISLTDMAGSDYAFDTGWNVCIAIVSINKQKMVYGPMNYINQDLIGNSLSSYVASISDWLNIIKGQNILEVNLGYIQYSQFTGKPFLFDIEDNTILPETYVSYSILYQGV